MVSPDYAVVDQVMPFLQDLSPLPKSSIPVSPIRATCLASLFFLDSIPPNKQAYVVNSTDHEASHYAVFFTPLLPRPS